MKKYSYTLLVASILAFSLFAGGCERMKTVANNSTTNGNPATEALPPSVVPPQSNNPEDKMPRVKVQDALKEYNDGTAVMIDVRGSDAYKMAHIKNALDIHLPDLENKNFKGLPKDKRIIAYCT